MIRIVLVYNRWSTNIYWKKKGKKKKKLTTIKVHLSRDEVFGYFKSLDHGHIPEITEKGVEKEKEQSQSP